MVRRLPGRGRSPATTRATGGRQRHRRRPPPGRGFRHRATGSCFDRGSGKRRYRHRRQSATVEIHDRYPPKLAPDPVFITRMIFRVETGFRLTPSPCREEISLTGPKPSPVGGRKMKSRLLVQPYILEAGAVVDAVRHGGLIPSHIGGASSSRPGLEDHGARDVRLGGGGVDLPDEPVAFCLVGVHGLPANTVSISGLQ